MKGAMFGVFRALMGSKELPVGCLGVLGGRYGVKELHWGHLWGLGGRYEAGGPTFGVFGAQIWGEMSHVWGAQKALMGSKELPVGSLGGLGGRYRIRAPTFGAIGGLGGLGGEIWGQRTALGALMGS